MNTILAEASDDASSQVSTKAGEVQAGLLARCPQVVVLATSREPLGVVGERVYRVQPLSLPGHDDSAPLGESEAVRLFVERAGEHRPGFALDPSNAEAVAAVVKRIDGIPLAIELAAARLRSLGIDDLRTRLDGSLRLLSGGSRTASERQQTLRALIDWSYQLLSERERIVLERLSVFSGGFELEAAETVGTDGEIDELDLVELLGALVDKSLVQVEDRGERLRYRLLETVREYASARLAERGEPDHEQASRAHRDYYLTLAETAEPLLSGRDQLLWLDRLEMEHNNLRAALGYCLVDTDPVPGLRLAIALNPFRQRRGYGKESATALLAHLERPETSEPTLLRAKALFAAGAGLASDAADTHRGETFCEQALAIARTHNDDHVTAQALGALGWVRFRQGRFAEMADLFAEGVTLARNTGDPRLLAELLDGHSSALLNSGADSREIVQEVIRLNRENEDRIGLAFGLQRLGISALAAGDARGARSHFEEARHLGDELGMTRFAWSTSINLGFAAYVAGDNATARAAFVDALEGGRDSWTLIVPHALLGLALTASSSNPNQAAILHGAVDRLLGELGLGLEMLEMRLREHDYRQLTARLGEARFREATERGRTQPTDELIDQVIAR